MKKYIFYSLIVFIFFESISNSSLEFFEKEKHDKLFKRILQNVCNPESWLDTLITILDKK